MAGTGGRPEVAIALDRVRALRALYATKTVGYREAARRIGISARSAARILAGQGRHANGEAVAADPDPDYVGKPVRCPICGHVRPAPCPVCAARAAQMTSSTGGGSDEPVELELRPAERRRYEELRRRPATVDAIMEELGAEEAIDERAADEFFSELGRKEG